MKSAVQHRSRLASLPSSKSHALHAALLGIAIFTAPPAAASVDSELAYHRGVVAYGNEDLDAAKAHFNAVLAEEPLDASALQFLGMIASKQGDPEDAIALFRRAVQISPADADIRFILGVALLHNDRAGEAGQEFARVLAVEPDNAQAEFYAGVADYRRQNYQETVRHMQAALSIDPSMRLQARYYIGLAEVFMGNLDASTAAFADAASLSPSDPLSISADTLGKAIQPESRWWGLDVTAGVEFDTNPTAIGNTRIRGEDGLADSIKRDSDVLGAFSIDTYYDLVDWEETTFRVGYSGFLSVHDDTREVNQFTHMGWADLGFIQGPLRLGVRVDITTTDLDLEEEYREMRRVSPSITYTNDDWGVTQVLYQYHDFDYRFAVVDDSLDPDGELHVVGISQFFYVSAPLTYIQVGIAYENADTQGTEFDFDGVDVSLGAGIELPYDLRAGARVSYTHRQGRHKSTLGEFGIIGSDTDAPLDLPKRKDNIANLKVDLTVPVAQYLEFAIRGSFTFTDSNIAVYDFNRHVVGSYFTFTF